MVLARSQKPGTVPNANVHFPGAEFTSEFRVLITSVSVQFIFLRTTPKVSVFMSLLSSETSKGSLCLTELSPTSGQNFERAEAMPLARAQTYCVLPSVRRDLTLWCLLWTLQEQGRSPPGQLRMLLLLLSGAVSLGWMGGEGWWEPILFSSQAFM